MSNVAYMKIGENKGAPRIYLQGRKLEAQGFRPGARYHVEMEPERRRLRLVRQDDGKRKVSAKNKGRTPVIDLNTKALEDLFAGVTRVRVVIRRDCILVTVHHQDAAREERVSRLKARIEGGQPLNIGSLAHGGGVLDAAIHKGLQATGIPSRLAFAVEIEDKYLETSLQNNPVWDEESIAVLGPMEEVEFHLLPKVEGLVAGIPCTGASLSGRAKNGLRGAEEHETAGALFVAFLAAVTTLNPAFVILENVPPYQNTMSMVVIRNVLDSLGYEVQERIVDGMGALEDRKRFVMVALTRGLDLPFDINTVMPIREKEACLAEILEPIPEDSPRWKTFSYLAEKEARDKAAGKGFRRQLLDGSEPGCGTIGRGYAKCRSTEPFIRHPSDPDLSRILTPTEHARVKTIPEELIAEVSDTTAHEILGQSVIFTAFEALGQAFGRALRQAA